MLFASSHLPIIQRQFSFAGAPHESSNYHPASGPWMML
jgi:hypothetical protein